MSNQGDSEKVGFSFSRDERDGFSGLSWSISIALVDDFDMRLSRVIAALVSAKMFLGAWSNRFV